MANIKSAKKRAKQNQKRRVQNRYYKVTVRSYVKEARKLIETGDLENAEEVVKLAGQALDKAAQKGVLHKNNASRRKSRLVQSLNKAKVAEQA